jgi:DNA-binding beta-propeller fold protein YncE
MKCFTSSRLAAAAASAIVLAVLAVSPALAANPLNQPRGLALDSKGNLYVANQGGNNIVAFNPSYGQMTAKTITAGIDKPTGIALDAQGNIYVSNWTTGEVTIYSPTGVQNTAATITGLNTPQGIAVDGIGNIFIDENYQDLKIYLSAPDPESSVPGLVTTYNAGGQLMFSVATHNQFLAWGGATVTDTQSIDSVLFGTVQGILATADEALAVTFDSTGNVYACNTNGSVTYINFAANSSSQFVALNFTCEGIVVDSARQRVYMSNQQGNAIAVYSTAGVLLKTIQ